MLDCDLPYPAPLSASWRTRANRSARRAYCFLRAEWKLNEPAELAGSIELQRGATGEAERGRAYARGSLMRAGGRTGSIPAAEKLAVRMQLLPDSVDFCCRWAW